MKISTELSQEEASKFFLSDPKLVLLGLSDDEIATLHKTKQYEFHSNAEFLTVRDDNNKILSIVKYDYFTTIAINYHMYVSSYIPHSAKLFSEMIPLIKAYFKKELGVSKAIVTIPDTCLHARNFALKAGFEIEARIKKSFQWRQSLVDLIIFSIFL